MADDMSSAPSQEEEGKNVSSLSSIPKSVTVNDDSDPELDDLDDVLDQFSPAQDNSTPKLKAQPQHPTPSASGPGRPPSSNQPSTAALPPLAAETTESEEDFMARLASEMSSVLGNLNTDQSASTAPPEDMSKIGKELDDLTIALEKQGIKPDDLLKSILGDAVGSTPYTSSSVSTSKPDHPSSSSTTTTTTNDKESTSFEETIRRTMERMQASDSHATTAASTTQDSSSEEDMLATLLKTMESGSAHPANDSSEDSLSQLFLTMMHQLTNKDMLYEPMKELDSKYPAWLADHKPSPTSKKLSEEEYKRYEQQRMIVREIVSKFEERGYSDEDAGCREFVWGRMQKMQELGSPPEDLIKNPLPGFMGGAGAAEGGGEADAGCTPQ